MNPSAASTTMPATSATWGTAQLEASLQLEKPPYLALSFQMPLLWAFWISTTSAGEAAEEAAAVLAAEEVAEGLTL